jgi:ATP-binding cassette subfamily B protein/ATP-binding cassette subfamily C protein
VTFGLESGRVLGLLGRTGSGKTTIARLVFRLYDPDGGEVRLGGVPITNAKLDELRDRVGMVTQDVQIFDASIRDNLAFFDPSIPDEALFAAWKIGLGAWFAAQPRGLDGGYQTAALREPSCWPRPPLPGRPGSFSTRCRLDPATGASSSRPSRLLKGSGTLIAHRLDSRAPTTLILEDGGGRARAASGPRR